jgi:hypothetical protein
MLWAITAYFNPARYRTRLENYRRFRAHLTVPLVTVEAGLDGRFELGRGDADILVQRHARDVLWQKERLLNVALGFLPCECDQVAWLDCDVVFAADDWPPRASAALTAHSLVQLFSERCDLDRDTTADPSRWREANSVIPAVASKIATGGIAPDDLFDPYTAVKRRFTSGLAWAARRESLDSQRFYDASVIGGGDRVVLCAALGEFDHISATRMGPRHAQHYRAWAASFADAMGGRIGYIDGRILHLWHGDLRDRRYGERHEVLKRYGFDPLTDVSVDRDGCWRWSSPKTDMHRYVSRYFSSRREDGRQPCSSENSSS